MKLMADRAQSSTLVEVGHMGATALAPCGDAGSGRGRLFHRQSIKTLADTRVGDTVTLK